MIRAPIALDTPTTLSVADGFDQAEGNATGKEAPVGGVYAAAPGSDTTDFTIAAGKLKRTASNDTGAIGGVAYLVGRGIAPSLKLTDVACSMNFTLSPMPNPATAIVDSGFILNYVDNTHYIAVVLRSFTVATSKIEVLDGANAVVASKRIPAISSGSLAVVVRGEALIAFLNGTALLAANHTMIGVEGKPFLYDKHFGEAAITRTYDDLAIWVPDSATVCSSGQSLEIRSDAIEREDATGKFWTPAPFSRGSKLYLEPEGEAGLVNRLAVKMRRNDTALEPDTNVGDAQVLEVLARERFLSPR